MTWWNQCFGGHGASPKPRAYYLYLTVEDWADAWINGGKVPINPASAYLSATRQGTRTPDEVHQRFSEGIPDSVIGVDTDEEWKPIKFIGNAAGIMRNCINFGPDGIDVIHQGFFEVRTEDGLILSLSTKLDGGLAKRLGKAACVRITALDRLIESLNAQIGVEARAGPIAYRDGFNRNHFLKGAADAWQHEYRLLWITNDVQARTVDLPARIAERVYW